MTSPSCASRAAGRPGRRLRIFTVVFRSGRPTGDSFCDDGCHGASPRQSGRRHSMRTTVLGVPSSAGAYCVGVERAPGALRAAGLVEQLRASGTDVVDAGDLTTRLWFPDRERPFAQNLGEEADALVELSTAAASLLAAEQRLLVLGGSCTVAVGLCDAMARAGERPSSSTSTGIWISTPPARRRRAH
ncbi:arginase family protein [Gordonia sp. p3-SID1431]|uniref:arginase family protein n=2 Tax=Gordonia TaxID=2053 RepID=UPI00288345C0|nr:arginase family protein [Gordonia sp. p3-SID1431]